MAAEEGSPIPAAPATPATPAPAPAADGALAPRGANAPAAGLVGLGLASLAGYKVALPRSVAAVRSPGAVAMQAFGLASLLCVGTFATALGGFAAYLDVRSVSEFSTLARAHAPERLRAVERALGIERRLVAADPAEEAAWRALDARLKRNWEEGDWQQLDETVREGFARYFDDRPAGPGGAAD